jgi:predicted nuclease of predicted toxin-antitoxin system
LRFLLNMNIPRLLGRFLETAGHSWRHIADLGLYKEEDRAVLAVAKGSEEIIVTHDLDYGHLLAFSGDTRPSVIIVRQRNIHPRAVFETIHRNWEVCGPALRTGAIVIIEEGALRIRSLPIGRPPTAV